MKEIQLTQGKFALVDDADFEWLNQWKWYASKKQSKIYYAQRGVDDIYMHRLILGISNTKIKGDHADHDGLNNQRYNLRIANTSQNAANKRPISNRTSNYLGVYLSNARGLKKRWVAQITKNGKMKHLGCFETEKEAAIAYNEASIKLHEQFANLNKW